MNRDKNASCSSLTTRSKLNRQSSLAKDQSKRASLNASNLLIDNVEQSVSESGVRRRLRKSYSETTCVEKLGDEMYRELEQNGGVGGVKAFTKQKSGSKKKLKVEFVKQGDVNGQQGDEDYEEAYDDEDDDDDDDDDDEDDYNEQLDYEDDLAYNLSSMPTTAARVLKCATSDDQSNLEDLMDEEPTNSSSFSVSNSEQSGYSMDDCVCKYNHYYFNHVNRRQCPNRAKKCTKLSDDRAANDGEGSEGSCENDATNGAANGSITLNSAHLDKLNNNVAPLPAANVLKKQHSKDSSSMIPTSLNTPISSISNASTPSSLAAASKNAKKQNELNSAAAKKLTLSQSHVIDSDTPTLLKPSSPSSTQKTSCSCCDCCYSKEQARAHAKNIRERNKRTSAKKASRDATTSAAPANSPVIVANIGASSLANSNAAPATHSTCPNVKKINCLNMGDE